MPPEPPSPPDGWDFSPEFLDDPNLLPPYIPSTNSPLFGSARRPVAADLRGHLRLQDDPHRAGVLQSRTLRPHTVALDGVRVLVDDPKRQRHSLYGPASMLLPEEALNRHWLWVGPPGVGKTTQGVMPMVSALLCDTERSLVVFDPKGDQFEPIRALAMAAGRSSRSVLRLNLTDPLSSLGWNPLRRGMSRTELYGIATTLVMASESKGSSESPFWRNTSIEQIVDVLLGLDRDPLEVLTLPRVLEIIRMPRLDLITWLRDHGVHRFRAYLESGSHNAETCLTDTSMRLLALLDLDLCAVLSHGELKLEQLFARPTVLVVEMNETRLETLRPIFNLLVQQILDHAIVAAERQPGSRLKIPLSVVIDEFGSAIGAIPRFPVYLNTLRSRRVSIIAAVQGLSQITALYQRDAGSVLVGFSSKVFFPGVDHDDAEFASRASGTMTVEAPLPDSQSMLIGRRVFLPEEVARPCLHPVLGQPITFLTTDLPPFQAYLTPCYRLPQFRVALAAVANRRRRRSRPLRYQPRSALPSKPGFTDASSMSFAAVSVALFLIEERVGLNEATGNARQFWIAWRKRERANLAVLLRVAEELAQRNLTITEYYLAQRECDCQSSAVVLLFLDYLIARRSYKNDQRDAS